MPITNRLKLAVLTLYCIFVLLFCLHYSSTLSGLRKRHSPIHLHGNFCVYHDAFGASQHHSTTREATTLVLHISADYLEEKTLFEQVSNWMGPISLAVYFDSPADQLSCVEGMLTQLWDNHPEIMHFLSVHYYTKADNCEDLLEKSAECNQKMNKTVAQIAAYPANVGRNIAREFIKTDYILMADYEHLFSHGFERRMTEIAKREKIYQSNTVLVYRIFEIERSAKNPKNKKDLSALLSSKKAVVFHERFYKGGHSIPKLDEWLKKKEHDGEGIAIRNLSMKGRSSWEPQFVSHASIPLHDEAFPYMIRDNTCLRWEMCRAGYTLHLVDDLFMYHRGIKTAKNVAKTKQIQSLNRKQFSQALGDFKKRMDLIYPSTKNICPTFRA